MSKKRRSFSAEFKAKVGLEALKGIEPVHVIAQRHEVHPMQVNQWRKEVAERLLIIFAKPSARVKDEIERDRQEPESDDNLILMEVIDETHLAYPFFGSRPVKRWLLLPRLSGGPQAGAQSDVEHALALEPTWTQPLYHDVLLRTLHAD